jgi:hypothetical protein
MTYLANIKISKLATYKNPGKYVNIIKIVITYLASPPLPSKSPQFGEKQKLSLRDFAPLLSPPKI